MVRFGNKNVIIDLIHKYQSTKDLANLTIPSQRKTKSFYEVCQQLISINCQLTSIFSLLCRLSNMAVRVTYRSKYSSLVSPGPDRKTPIYNWHAFKHSYSNKLVKDLMLEFNLPKGSWVLDPFCGGGTTLLAAKHSKMNSLGVDILPFSVFLSNVKTRNYDETALLNCLKTLRKDINPTNVIDVLPNDIGLLTKAFPKKIKDQLLRIKHQVNQIDDLKCRDFFNLSFLSILESVSNTSKDGGFLRIVERNISPQAVRGLFLDKCATMIGDILRNNNHYKINGLSSKAKLGDARSLPTKRQFQAIITSPPYPNRHDYTRIYSLEMAFDFIKNNTELKKIRYDTLRSHVEAKKRFDANGYIRPRSLQRLITQIEKNGTNNSQVTAMLDGYFEDMHLCLQQMKQNLAVEGKIALVVSNVRFSGINIPVDTLLSDLGAQIGLKPKAIWAARKRGNSAQQMGKYKRKPSRESIVVWEN